MQLLVVEREDATAASLVQGLRNVDAHVVSLRKELGDPTPVETVGRVGVRLRR